MSDLMSFGKSPAEIGWICDFRYMQTEAERVIKYERAFGWSIASKWWGQENGSGESCSQSTCKIASTSLHQFFYFYRAFVVKMWWFCVTSQSNRYTDKENSVLFSAYLSFQSISNLFFTFYIKLLAILWDAVSSVFERILVNLIPLFIDRLIEHKQLFDSMRISRFNILCKIRSAKFNAGIA